MAASWPPPPVVHRYPRAAPQHATLRVAVRAVPALTCSLACVLPASVATDTIYHSNEPQNTPCKRLVSGQRRGSSNTLAMAPGPASLRASPWSRTTCVDGSESDVDKEHPSIEQTALDEDLCAAGLFCIDAGKKNPFNSIKTTSFNYKLGRRKVQGSSLQVLCYWCRYKFLSNLLRLLHSITEWVVRKI